MRRALAVSLGSIVVLLATLALVHREPPAVAANARRAAGAPCSVACPSASPTGDSCERAPARVKPSPNQGPAARELAERRVARASQTLVTYLDATRYPPDSRPLAERPDLARPHAVARRELPFAASAGRARVELEQSRWLVAKDEELVVRARCSIDGAPARCAPRGARARFEAGGDVELEARESDDGTVSATLAPSRSGLVGAARVELALALGEARGTFVFDAIVSGDPPAVFDGFEGDAMEEGSLVVGLRVRVARAGRYVVRARFADETGAPFALATFQGELAPGDARVPLRLFGRLARDRAAESPFHVRDLEGFRLLEDVFPDREAMTGIDGDAYTTRAYRLDAFSSDDWTSPDKERHASLLVDALDRARTP